MNCFIVLILMIFCHIVDDYYLQGILSSMKQKEWWEKNYPNKMYKHDYIIALIIHALSWSIMILLPILFISDWNPHWLMYVIFGIDIIIHAITDNLKANKHKINLIADQTIHFAQIIFTWVAWIIINL